MGRAITPPLMIHSPRVPGAFVEEGSKKRSYITSHEYLYAAHCYPKVVASGS
jgi:hypothetical protein